MRVDLHTHSTASDGTDAPADLPRLVKAAGLDGFALTDHDTTAGLAQAGQVAKAAGLRFVPGIELSATYDHDKPGNPTPASDEPDADARHTLHLLGYHIQPDAPSLATITERLRNARATRNPQIIEKLRELGVRIEYEDVVSVAEANSDEQAGPTAIGRPHIAQVMVQRGYVKSIHEAFARYLGQGGAAYTPRELPTAGEAIDAIHAAAGVAVLAHPVHLAMGPDDLEHTIAKLADLGLDGLESRHSDHEPGDTRKINALADRFDLLTTGGSDYHGSRKAIALGSVVAPDDALQQLEEAAAAYGKV